MPRQKRVGNFLQSIQRRKTDSGARPEPATLLVRIEDEAGRDWAVYEQDPRLEPAEQRITAGYDFRSGGQTFAEHVVRATPPAEQPTSLLDRKMDRYASIPTE